MRRFRRHGVSEPHVDLQIDVGWAELREELQANPFVLLRLADPFAANAAGQKGQTVVVDRGGTHGPEGRNQFV
jgi:hypothetical protein